MTTLTQAKPSSSFILSDMGRYSYANGTVASGQTLDAGEAVMLSGGNIVTWDGGTDNSCVGFMLAPVDASDGAVAAAYLARGAEVLGNEISYPTGTLTILQADLLALNPQIIIR